MTDIYKKHRNEVFIVNIEKREIKIISRFDVCRCQEDNNSKNGRRSAENFH